MKTIGLIGGMSWESSLEYYRLINERVQEKLGGLHSARCIMYSVDFADVEPLLPHRNWDELTRVLIDCARKLERAGADCIVICTNTMHHVSVIFDELCRGILRTESKARFSAIFENLVRNGAEGVILGCTEIPLLIKRRI